MFWGELVLDIRTLILILSATTCLNGLVAWLLYRRTQVTGPLWWAIGTTSVSLGLLLIALRGQVGVIPSVVISNGLILAGYAIVWDGMRRYSGRLFSLPMVLVAVTIIFGCIVGNFHYSVVDPLLSARVLINTLGILFFSVAISNSLLVAKFGRASVTFTATAYSVNAIVNGLRLIGPVVFPSVVPFMQSGTFAASFILFSIFFSLVVILGQILMVKEEISEPADKISIGRLLFS